MQYIYTAVNSKGESTGGKTEAQSEKEVAEQLKARGYLITSIKVLDEKKSNKSKIDFASFFSSVSLKDKMMFAKNLSVMLGSGLILSRSLQNLISQTKNKSFRDILQKIYDDVEGGKSLSDSLAAYPTVFNNLFVSMVRVGEIGGNLEETLQIVSLYLEKDYKLKKQIKGAMIYPVVVILAMVGVTVLMLTFILPKIMSVFQDMDVELPKPTQFVIALSNILRDHSILVIIFTVLLLVGGKLFLKTKIGKKWSSFVLLNLPVVGSVVKKTNSARFTRTYSSLLHSGVSAIDALKITSETLDNYYYKEALTYGVKEIQKGVDLSDIINQYPQLFPILVPQIIEVGEETGKTDVMLLKLAEFYEDEVDQFTKNISSVIEPVLILLIGVMVGFFAVAMLQPMYSVMENIK